MTQKHDIPTQQRNRKVIMVTYPAAHFLPDGPAPYDVTVVAAKAGPVATTSGLTIDAQASFAEAMQDLSEIDTLIVSGGHGTASALKDNLLLDYVCALG